MEDITGGWGERREMSRGGGAPNRKKECAGVWSGMERSGLVVWTSKQWKVGCVWMS